MQVFVSVLEAPPAAFLAQHTHLGEEAVFALECAMVEIPGRAAALLPTGVTSVDVRDVPRAGFAVVGDRTLKLLNVHVVDKGKPVAVRRDSARRRPRHATRIDAETLSGRPTHPFRPPMGGVPARRHAPSTA